MPLATSRRGSLVADRYRIDEAIAAGGMGEVWRATDEVLGRVVGVKFLHPQYALDETFLERMLREARAASSVNHPGVVAVYDFGRIDPEGDLATSYIVMEHVDGPSLAQILLDGPLTVERSLAILEQVSAALHAAHEAGVIHRDVKPGNILVTAGGEVKLTDFGIARSHDATPLTETGSITGTAHYLSPEQAGGQAATGASDLYSLGVVVYSCLTGAVPFTRDGAVAIALAHIQDEPPSLPPEIPPEVSSLVMSLLAKDVADRPSDAEAVRARAAQLRGQAPADPVPPVITPASTPDATVVSAAVPASAETTGADATAVGLAAAPNEDPRHGRRRGLLVLAAVVAALLLGTLAYAMFGRGVEPVAVPSVVGLTQDEARAELDRVGLEARVETKDVAEEEAGTVVEQSEDAGAEVKSGSTVGLTVASGKVTLPVEDLIGATYAEAESLLDELGLDAEQVFEPSASTAGTVVDIGGNVSRVDVGSTVELLVATPAVQRGNDEDDSSGKGEKGKKDDKGSSDSEGSGSGDETDEEPPPDDGEPTPTPEPTTPGEGDAGG